MVGRSSETVRRAALPSKASSTSASLISSSSAISATVGERSSSWLSLVIAPSTARMLSCRPRGTRSVQTRSRKCRRSSPRIVGPAKAANGTPRSGS